MHKACKHTKCALTKTASLRRYYPGQVMRVCSRPSGHEHSQLMLPWQSVYSCILKYIIENGLSRFSAGGFYSGNVFGEIISGKYFPFRTRRSKIGMLAFMIFAMERNGYRYEKELRTDHSSLFACGRAGRDSHLTPGKYRNVRRRGCGGPAEQWRHVGAFPGLGAGGLYPDHLQRRSHADRRRG